MRVSTRFLKKIILARREDMGNMNIKASVEICKFRATLIASSLDSHITTMRQHIGNELSTLQTAVKYLE